MAIPCSACGRGVDARYSCPDCGEEYCTECLLPDEHDCPGYQGSVSSSADYDSSAGEGGADGTGSARTDGIGPDEADADESPLGCPACGVVDAFLYECPACGVSHCADCHPTDAHGCVPRGRDGF